MEQINGHPTTQESPLDKEILLLIHSYLIETGRTETATKLELETGIRFNWSYFEKSIKNGEWVNVENYLKAFPLSSKLSRMMFFDIRKEKFMEALYRDDKEEALNIFAREMEEYKSDKVYEDLFRLCLSDLKSHATTASFTEQSGRTKMINKFKEAAPHLLDGGYTVDANKLKKMLIQGYWSSFPNTFRPHAVFPPQDIKSLLDNHKCDNMVMEEPMPARDPEKRSGEFIENPKERKKAKRELRKSDLPTQFVFPVTLNGDSHATAVHFHPKKTNILFVGGSDGTLSIINVTENKLIALHSIVTGLPITRIVFSPDCSFLCTIAGHIQVLKLVDLHVKLLKELPQITPTDLAFVMHRGEQMLVAGDQDSKIYLWDMKGNLVKTMQGHTGPVLAITSFDRTNATVIASVSSDGTIKLWCVGNTTETASQQIPGGACGTGVACVDGRLFSCGSGEATFVEWALEEKNKLIRTFKEYNGAQIARTLLSFISNKIVLLVDDEKIKFWNVDSEQLWESFQPPSEVSDIAVNTDSTILASVGKDLLIYTTAASVDKFSNASKPLTSTMAPSVGEHGSIDQKSLPKQTVPLTSSLEIKPLHLLHQGAQGPIISVTYNHFTQALGGGIITLSEAGVIKYWRWNTDTSIPTLNMVKNGESEIRLQIPHPLQTATLQTTNNDNYLLVSCEEKSCLYHLKSYAVVTDYNPGEPVSVATLATQDNNILAAGIKSDNTIRIHLLSLNVEQLTLRIHRATITALVLAKEVLISADSDGQVLITKLNLAEKTITVEGKELKYNNYATKNDATLNVKNLTSKPVLSLCYHQPTQRVLVVQSGYLYVVNVVNGQVLTKKMFDSAQTITAATLSADCTYVFCVLDYKKIIVLHFTSTLQVIKESSLPEEISALCIAKHPNNLSEFAIGCSDGIVRTVVFK